MWNENGDLNIGERTASQFTELVERKSQSGKREHISLKPMNLTVPERIEWLWPGMLAKGKLHVFAGDSGIGKTLILTNISATVSRGGIFPGAKEPCEAGKVVYLTGEDGLEDTIVPRLLVSGANMENMLALNSVNPDGELLDLGSDLDYLADEVSAGRGISLLILDPVSAFCGRRFDNDSVTYVRRITTKLAEFASQTGAAVIALQHLTKSHQTKMKNRVLGSGAWVHGPRIVLGAIKHREDDSVFGKIKANITDTYGVYPYRINARDLNHNDVYLEDVHYIEWLEPHWPFEELHNYEEGVEAPVRGETGQRAHEALHQVLSDGGWHDRQEVIDKCLEAGNMCESTIKRAAGLLGVQNGRTSDFPARTVWRIPQ
jgi:RecA-family ATPase